MDWKHQTVLVTGGGGFIGSHLVERLVALGARTRALLRYNSANSRGWLDSSPVKEEIEVAFGDICDRDTLKPAMENVDVVFHLAALIAIPYSYRAPRSYVRTNIEGTLNVLQGAMECGAKLVIHTSTSEVYGTARRVPIDEDHPLQGQSPYSASKIGADKIAEAFYSSFGLPVATVRPFNTFGPRQSARAVIPTIISQALTQPVVRLGNQRPTRDFNYVTDTVEAFVRVAECPKAVGEVTNIGTGKDVAIGDLASLILNLIGQQKDIISDDQRVRPQNSEVDRLCAGNSKAREMLGWRPQLTLKDGLVRTIEWMEQHLEQYRPETYTL